MHHGISRFRKMAVAAVATVATTAGLLPLAATGAGATASFDLTRLAGADRYGTAQAISAASFPTATDVVLATGENFPDALAGNYLAGNANAPILLTTRTSVPAATQTEINRLNPQRIWVLGGTDAIGAGGVPTTSATVNRVAGATRYETAVAADSTGTVGTLGGKPTAIIATGDKFADALSAGPGAYAGHFPLYLTPGAPATALHPATKSALTSRGITNVILMGGVNAVSAAVATELQGMGITVTRVEGADRTETARAFANWLKSNLGFSSSLMDVARGDLFPDALAGGPHSGKEKAPILLTWTPQEASPGNNPALGALKYASDNASTLTGGHIFGGIQAVSSGAETAIEAAGKGAGNTTVTARPEVVSARIVSTTTTGQATTTNPAGTIVAYTFDEPVSSPLVANFHVYHANGTQETPTGVTAAASVSSTDNKTVNVFFPQLNTTTANVAGTVADLTVATVEFGAVIDFQSLQNPEGDAAIGSGSTTTTPAAAGRTAAPDIVSVGGFRATTTANVAAIDFTFDQAATVQNTTGFHVVSTSGEDVACTGPAVGGTTAGGQNIPGGNGTTVITVNCGPFTIPAAAMPSGTNVARGYVLQGTVGTTQPAAVTGGVACGGTTAGGAINICNPLESSDTPDVGTPAPDLVSAAFQPSTATPATSDTVVYTFDAPVTTGAASNFLVYQANGNQIGGATAAVNPANNSQVAVTFPAGTLSGANGGAPAVGASVNAAAVTLSGGAATNAPDEVGVTPTTSGTTTTLTPGRTAGPDLVSVALTVTRDAFGAVSGVTATYTFDEAVTAPVNTKFFLYLNDAANSKATCGTATAGATATSTPNNTQVVCTGFTGAPSLTALAGAVLGTVDDTAVTAADAGPSNPEGAEPTTGGTGTAVA